jgi:hypothetical protein
MSAHIEELSDLYLTKLCSDHQIERNEMGGACSTYGEMIYIYSVLVGDLRERGTTWKTQA